ncbi:Per1-domain-containing protein [Metschnikowia bicuspidata]|uniref:Post-GPI attachment to proteins factor 3 n=1 Tax=Metschnikowia bicuspidata TaxID=27322 RepID=A0A4P9ZCY5_9ASCO|nr:Per1-domain-containing protein [Metschnikowia bicuspidata]
MVPSQVLGYFLLSILGLLTKVAASDGDELEEFEDCLYQCTEITCHKNPYHIKKIKFEDTLKSKNHQFHRYEPSWHFDKLLQPHLRAMLWDCKSNCDYQCQRIITAERRANGEDMCQFHGKWPFLRVLGIQELASAVFSIANFFPHLQGFKQAGEALRTAPKTKYNVIKGPMRTIQFVLLVTMCAWVFSTIYHIRDFLITEQLDYYFAGLTVLAGFYGIGHRYFRLYLPSRRHYLLLFLSMCVLAYAGHVYRLVSDWLYTYNMTANIVVGVLQNILWCLTCYSLYTKYYELDRLGISYDTQKHLGYTNGTRMILGSFYCQSAKLYSLYPLAICFVVVLGISLELSDFPPVFFELVDTHSLWHFVTAISSYMGWYKWMIWDISENVWDDLQAGKKAD